MVDEKFLYMQDEDWRRDMDELTLKMSREPSGFRAILFGLCMFVGYCVLVPIFWIADMIHQGVCHERRR